VIPPRCPDGVDDRTALRLLARAHGVCPGYTDNTGRRHRASRSALLGVLASLGSPVERPSDAPAALRALERGAWRRMSEPVAVAWEGRELTLSLRLARGDLRDRVAFRLVLEDGAALGSSVRTRDLPVAAETRIGRESFVELTLRLRGPWPLGYHRLEIETGRRFAETLVISAPLEAFRRERPGWGVFLPLHALHADGSWGAGSYADLGRLVDWTAELGGDCVGTLPLLPTFLDRPFDPSPYMPISRLFWSELHLAPQALDGLRLTAGQRRRLACLRALDHVDHRRQAALLRELLEPLSRRLDTLPSARAAWRRFVRARPEVPAYARFRAATERLGPWQRWPARARDGELRARDVERAAERYHGFVQWLAAEQLEEVRRRAAAGGVRLYLDLPLGVHPAGFDVWRERGLFARDAAAGAPPDAFYAAGQSWCFPPIRPEASREQGHRYVAACLRHHMRAAGMLRLDHVMSLHRLFWIPDGHEPRDGLYVRQPTEELYAIVCLESRRHRCAVVGEDLGTVPRDVRPALRRHGLSRTWVVQGSVGPRPGRPLESMRARGVAALHTHDMPTFAAFWRGLDIALRLRLGHLTAGEARRARRERERMRKAWTRDLRRGGWLTAGNPRTASVLRACLAFLADGPAEVVLVDLEDLWGEVDPQNVPGTTSEHPNWRRRARHGFDTFSRMPAVLRVLRDVGLRRG